MSSLNKVMLIGRLGRDPELRYTQANTAVCTFSIATDESWTDKESGEKREEVEWSRIVCWGKQGENAEKYLSKGRQVFVEGKLKTRQWEDKDGNKKWSTEIVAHRVLFLGGKDDGGGNRPPEHDDDDVPDNFSDDEIPF